MLIVESAKQKMTFFQNEKYPNAIKTCVTGTHCSACVCWFTHSSTEWLALTATESPLHSQTAFMKMKSHCI